MAASSFASWKMFLSFKFCRKKERQIRFLRKGNSELEVTKGFYHMKIGHCAVAPAFISLNASLLHRSFDKPLLLITNTCVFKISWYRMEACIVLHYAKPVT